MKKIVLINVILGLLTSCQLLNPTSPTSQDSIPISTIEWKATKDGFITFETNNLDNCDYTFLTSWPGLASTDSLEALLERTSGSSNMPFGLIFRCPDKDNGYEVRITAEGRYQVLKQVAGSYSTLVDWTASTLLYTGNGAPNLIWLWPVDSGFVLYFNSHFVTTINDLTFTTGRYGLFSWIGKASQETFPKVASSIRGRILLPNQKPSTADSQVSSYRKIGP